MARSRRLVSALRFLVHFALTETSSTAFICCVAHAFRREKDGGTILGGWSGGAYTAQQTVAYVETASNTKLCTFYIDALSAVP